MRVYSKYPLLVRLNIFGVRRGICLKSPHVTMYDALGLLITLNLHTYISDADANISFNINNLKS